MDKLKQYFRFVNGTAPQQSRRLNPQDTWGVFGYAMQMRKLIILLAVTISGCAQQLPVIKFTDIQSRREYKSIGTPAVLPSGAVSFKDETSGHAVTLQSWEAEDDQGRYYTAQFDPIWGGYHLVPGSPKSK